MKPINFDIKKFKSFTGREGYGFNAELWMDGKKAAFVIDEASGGEFSYHWENNELEAQFTEYVKALPREPIASDAPDWEKEMHPKGRAWDDDRFMAALVDLHATFVSIKRKAAKATLFVLPNAPKGRYYTVKLPFKGLTRANIFANPKNAGAQFINEHLSDGKWVSMLGLKPLPVPMEVVAS